MARMPYNAAVWYFLLIVTVKCSLGEETPPFKPLVPGVESVLNPIRTPQKQLLDYLDSVLSQWADNINLTKGITLKRIGEKEGFAYLADPDVSLLDSLANFVKQYAVRVRLLDVAQEFSDGNELQELRDVGRCKCFPLSTFF